jgi:hypothetical protein
VFVLSSRYEGLPGTLIQAMACGTRVVATDCPSGPSEILEAGRWGRLVPVGDPAALAAAIGAALDDPAPPDGRARATCYSVDAAVDGYARVLGLRGGAPGPLTGRGQAGASIVAATGAGDGAPASRQASNISTGHSR